MGDFLNQLGLPLKYAILCFVLAGLGVFLARMVGITDASYLPGMIGGGIGGAIAGYLRKRRGLMR